MLPAALLLLLVLLPVRAAAEEHRTPSWTQLLPGLDAIRFSVETPETALTVTFIAVRLELRSYTLHVLDARDHERSAWTAKSAARASGALVTINGSFFDSNDIPLGLLVSEGHQKSPLRKVDWGVLSLREGKPRIVHTRDWKSDDDVTFAIQTGPRLVVAGKTLSLKPNLARRSAVCIDPRGRLLLVVTEGPLMLAELAEVLRRPTSEAGLGCRDAINLDGGSSTQLYFSLKGAPDGVVSSDKVPIVLGVFPN